jgi:hypothetical protein
MKATSAARPQAHTWVRLMLLGVAAGLLLAFAIALWLNPYDADGRPLRLETHRQLGLPPCKFYEMFGQPCPACGLTTSFSLLMHGDISGSLRANAVGTLLAVFCLGLIPWSLLVAVRGRYLWVRSLERASLWVVGILFALLLIRWGIVLLL